MPKVAVRFRKPRSRGYDVHIQPGLLAQAGLKLRARFKGHQAFIISSPKIWGLWGKTLQRGLAKGGFVNPGLHLVPDGEKNKNFRQVERGLKALAKFGRASQVKPLVLLLGGGVIGDLGGFVASCYKRGLPFVQIPTTLLSMVDSSVGGKLGVDFETPQGLVKNLVGSFYQPQAVLIDPMVLKTLDARQVRAGLGEVVKTAVLFDPPLFRKLEKNTAKLLSLNPALYASVIRSCVAHKARVVGKDEFDREGLRTQLNLGHTFGHAVESASQFKLLHGEAVAFGLACAVDLAVDLGLAKGSKAGELARVEPLLNRLGLATRLTRIGLGRTLAAMSQDKKFDGGMKFILPLRLGKSVLKAVAREAAAVSILRSRLA